MEWSKFYDRAYSWILNLGPRLLIGLVLVFLGLWLIRFLKRWLNHHLFQRDVNASIRPFLVDLIVTTLQIFLVIAFMQIVGLQLTIFTALIGAVGVAAGLALSGTLQNFTSGILILLLKPFKAGDNISAQGNEGTVEAIELFFTIMRTYDNRTIIVPNSKLSNEIIVNLSREDQRRIDVELKFSFGIDFNQVKTVIDKSVASVEALLKTPEHRVGVSSVDPDGYKVMVNAWAHAHGYIDTRLVLQQRLMEDLKAAGIKLPGM
jgi:small conductance mechanosensitive channel